MRYLLLVSHGSRREASNDEVRQLALKMNAMNHDFDKIACAFLELAEPLIPEGIRQAIAQGADEVVVLPYFLSAGRHVAKDVPAEVELVQKERPDKKITIAPYLGSATSIASILLEQAES